MSLFIDAGILKTRPLSFGLLYCVSLLFFIACVPACAAAAPAHISARDYEQQGMALMAEKNWSALMITMDEGLAIYPGDGELYCLKGYALRMTGQYREAADTVSHAIEWDPKPVRYVNRGYALLALGRYQDALSDARMAISLDSNYTKAYCVKAMAMLGLGRYPEAQQAIGAALALDPKSALYWQVQGNIMAQSGNCNGAAASLRRSIELEKDDDLPWPDLPDATADLERTEAECTGGDPVPTRAALPATLAGAAFAIAIGLKRQ